MNVFMDLDGVALDTVRLIERFKEMLVENGISREAIDDFYRRAETPPQYMSRTYCLICEPWRYQMFFGIKEDHRIEKLMLAVDDFLRDLSPYVFPDAKIFFESFCSNDLVLVSYGGNGWQNLKIDRAGLRRHFREVIITHGAKKSDALREFQVRNRVEMSRGVFIDDRGKEINLIKEAFPEITAILVVRPGGKFNHEISLKHDFSVVDLREAGNIIGRLAQSVGKI
jgi:FMN phosphatase YigB (HAD superfamily)